MTLNIGLIRIIGLYAKKTIMTTITNISSSNYLLSHKVILLITSNNNLSTKTPFNSDRVGAQFTQRM